MAQYCSLLDGRICIENAATSTNSNNNNTLLLNLNIR